MENSVENNIGLFELLGPSIQLLVLEALSVTITFAAVILIVVSAIKLYNIGDIPGSKAILISISGHIIGIILYLGAELIFENASHSIFEALIDITLAVFFAFGAYGFWLLTKFLYSKENADK